MEFITLVYLASNLNVKAKGHRLEEGGGENRHLDGNLQPTYT